jgi:diguanylate cyclase (GGDEF)-like protein
VVLDRRGTIVARTQQHERFTGQPGAAALVKRVAEAPEGAIETDTLEGIPVISAYSRSPATGWVVALGIPRESVTAPLWNRSILVGGAVLVIVALGLALAWGIGGKIAGSIRALEKPASDIGRREEIEVPPLGLREADEVGQALVRAAQMIALAQHRAQHDPLTGLANRSLFLEMASHNVETAKRTGAPLSLLFIDLDGFKGVNDTFGHDAGDRLLCAVAERMNAAGRGSDVPARMGGDEFAMLLPGVGADGAATFAAKLAQSLSEPYAIGSQALMVTASIGSSTYPQSGANAHDLVKRADEAMYRAKRRP